MMLTVYFGLLVSTVVTYGKVILTQTHLDLIYSSGVNLRVKTLVRTKHL